MKPNIHPEYRPVAFVDLSINKTFIIPSAVQTRETVEIDGVTYPLFKLDTSSASHPFYTGAQTRIVEAGRVEKFRAKFAAKKQALNHGRRSCEVHEVIRQLSPPDPSFRRRRAISRSAATRPPHYKRAPTHSPESKKGEPLKT